MCKRGTPVGVAKNQNEQAKKTNKQKNSRTAHTNNPHHPPCLVNNDKLFFKKNILLLNDSAIFTQRGFPAQTKGPQGCSDLQDHSSRWWNVYETAVKHSTYRKTTWSCRGRPVCLGLLVEARVCPLIPSNYTAAYSVWWCLAAAAAVSRTHLHIEYLNPFSQGPTHLNLSC